MGSEEEAANQLFDRDDSLAALRVDAIKEETFSDPNGYWVTDPSMEVKLRTEEKGAAAESPYTVLDMFRDIVEKHKNNPAIAIKKMGSWHHWTYEKYYSNCQTVAKAFIEVRNVTALLKLPCAPYHSLGWNPIMVYASSAITHQSG